MAISARDLYFAVRVDDRATRPLRRISNEIRGLRSLGGGERQARQLALQQAQVTARRARDSRMLAQQELQTHSVGTKRLAQEKAALATIGQGIALRARQAGIEDAVNANLVKRQNIEGQIYRSQANLTKMRERQAAGLTAVKGMSPAASRLAMTGEMQRLQGLRAAAYAADQQLGTLSLKSGMAKNALAQHAIAVQSLSAAEAEWAAREQLLTSRLQTRAGAEEVANNRVLRATRLLNNLPVERLQAWGQVTRQIGRGMRLVGIVGTAAAGFAAYQAAHFQTQLALAATQARAPGAPITQNLRIQDQMAKAVQNMMLRGQVTAPPEQQTQSLYEIFSGLTLPGSPGGNRNIKAGINLLKEFNKVAVANYGLVDLNEVTKAGIVVMNNFGVAVRDVPKALNTMQAAVRFGKMTMSEFIGTFNQAAPAARAAHYSFTQMSEAIAFLSRKFPSIRMAATGYARLTEIFANRKTIEGLKKIGIDAVDSHNRLLPLDQLIAKILEKRPELAQGGVGLQNFFKEISGQTGFIQARRAFVAFARDLAGFRTIMKDVRSDTQELPRSFAAMEKTPAVKWSEFVNQLKAFVFVAGRGVLPVFGRIGEGIQRLVNWFRQLSPHTQRMIGYFFAIVSVGAVLGGTLLSIFGGLMSLVFVARLLAGAGGFGGLAAEGGILSVRLALMLGPLAGLLILLYKYPGTVKKVTDAFGGFKGILEILGVAIAALTFVKIIGGLAAIDEQAMIAGGAVTGLRLRLAGLNGMRVVATIAIAFAADKFIMDWVKGSQGKTGLDPLERMANYLNKRVRIPGGVPLLGGLSPFRHYTPDISKMAPEFRGAINAPPILKGQQPVRQAVWSSFYGGWVNATTGLPLSPQQANQAQKAWDAAHIVKTKPRNRSVADLTAVGSAIKTIKGLGQQGLPPLKSAVDEQNRNIAALREAYAKAERFAKQHPGSLKALEAADAARQKLAAAVGKRDAMLTKQSVDAQIREENRRTKAAEREARKRARAEEAAARKAEAAQKKANDAAINYQQQAVQTLMQKWDEFIQSETQAMGQLFQGPMFTGRFGVFGQLLDIPGIKLPFEVLNRDIEGQISKFEGYQQDIAILRRRGVPKEFVTELQGAGVAAFPMIDTLARRTSRSQLNEYISHMRTRKADIYAATRLDFQPVLDTWKQHGKEIMQAIVAGMQSGDYTLFSTLKKSILADLRGEKPPTGHGRSGTVNVTTNNAGDVINMNLSTGDPKLDAMINKAIWKILHGKRNK